MPHEYVLGYVPAILVRILDKKKLLQNESRDRGQTKHDTHQWKMP